MQNENIKQSVVHRSQSGQSGRRLRSRRFAAVAMAASLVAGVACHLDHVLDPVVNPANAAVAAIDDAVSKITAVSGSWQQVLQDTMKQLTADAQSTVRNEIQTLLQNSISAVQVSVMCTVDFVGARVVQALQEIKAELLGRSAPVPQPFVCSSAPTAIEFEAWQQNRVPVVTLTGFDLRATLQVTLVQTTGSAVVPNVLAGVSPYQATINLGATGLKLTPQSQRITVSTTATPPFELTAINVVQPLPRICQERDISPVFPAPISLAADNRTQGDGEFNGNGPRITASIRLMPVSTGINYIASMIAAETGGDHSQFQGFNSGTLALSPPLPSGVRVLSINGSALISNADYTDSNTFDDHVRSTTGGPVSEFVFVGDTSGDDFGKTRMVSATFNALSLHVVETVNCVPKAQAKELIESKQTTPALVKHLQDALKQ